MLVKYLVYYHLRDHYDRELLVRIHKSFKIYKKMLVNLRHCLQLLKNLLKTEQQIED